MLFRNLKIFGKSLVICGYEYIRYKLNYINENELLNNISTKLSRMNILYTKILQWVINDNIYMDDNLKRNFEMFIENVEYTDDDIDYGIIINMLNNERIKLDSTVPIKSGTISLVYKAKLDNKDVIIKLRKKNIEAKLEEAVDYFNFLGKICNYIPIVKNFNLDRLINRNKGKLMMQIDFAQEAENTELFYYNFKDDDEIIIPKIYKNYTLDYGNVLVMDYIEGKNAFDIIKTDKLEYTDILYQFLFKCMFNYNTFHGDLHPGNLFFIEEGGKKKLGVIDFGIIREFENGPKYKICNILKYINEAEYNKLFKYIIDHVVEVIDNKITIENDKIEIVDKLIKLQKENNMLTKNIKAMDVYYLNNCLMNYNLVLSMDFSEVFLYLSSMYSLLYILQEGFNDDLFKHSFKRYCTNNLHLIMEIANEIN